LSQQVDHLENQASNQSVNLVADLSAQSVSYQLAGELTPGVSSQQTSQQPASHPAELPGLEAEILYQFNDKNLLQRALTHKSFANECGEVCLHNEVLELLGDAVIALVSIDILMPTFPNDDEGQLSKKRASLVNEEALADVARILRLDRFLRMGRGEQKSGGATKPRLLASCFEALVGAIYQDAGLEPAKKVISNCFQAKIQSFEKSKIDFQSDFKTRLQEFTQAARFGMPQYQIIGSEGPDHEKSFQVSVSLINGKSAVGIGRSKKSAEQEAARVAILEWRLGLEIIENVSGSSEPVSDSRPEVDPETEPEIKLEAQTDIFGNIGINQNSKVLEEGLV
jgi:ribonuclease III